ncbi:MAG: hypothetical protein ACHQAY_06590 [Hyphomicrobiales bacterium]
MRHAAIIDEARLIVSVREARLVVQRSLLVAGVPNGMIADVGDAVLYAEGMGLHAFERLAEMHDRIWRESEPITVSIGEDASPIADCRGRHAWLAAPSLLDLLAECGMEARSPVLVARDVADIGQLAVLATLCGKTGQRLRVEVGGSSARITALSQPKYRKGEVDPFLRRLLREGLEVRAALWWRLYHLSNKSLSPDSVQSRRHAGPIIVEADGRIIGRADSDDDTDVGFLLRPDPIAGAPLDLTDK